MKEQEAVRAQLLCAAPGDLISAPTQPPLGGNHLVLTDPHLTRLPASLLHTEHPFGSTLNRCMAIQNKEKEKNKTDMKFGKEAKFGKGEEGHRGQSPDTAAGGLRCL